MLIGETREVVYSTEEVEKERLEQERLELQAEQEAYYYEMCMYDDDMGYFEDEVY